MKRGLSVVSRPGAVLIGCAVLALLFCGCSGPGEKKVQENESLMETTTEHPQTTLPALAEPVRTTLSGQKTTSSTTTTTPPEERAEPPDALSASCGTIKDPQLTDLCIRAYANARNDSSLCKNITQGDDRDGCYCDMAWKTKEPKLCDVIQSNNTKTLCKAAFDLDPSACRDITNADMQCECYLGMILPAENESLCEDVNPTACRGRCFYEYAVRYDKPELCQRAEDGSRDSCYRVVAEANLDPSACSGSMQSSDICYLDMAAGLGDPTLCGNITYSKKDLIRWCNAAAKRNDSLCDAVKDGWTDCIYYLARLTGDESICERTDDKTWGCYIALAEYGRDPALCERIKGASEKDRCLASSAAARNDVALCGKVSGRNYLEECYSSFIDENARGMLLGGKSRVFP